MEVGGNYLFNLNKNQKLSLDFKTNHIYDTMALRDNYYAYCAYTAFYPINCDIEIKNDKFQVIGNNGLKDNIIFYQTIGISMRYSDIQYEIKNKNNFVGDSCLIYVSTYNLNSTSFESSDSAIILQDNNHQYFILNTEFKELNYSYYFIENNKDININISLFHKAILFMTIFINNKNQKNYTITSNEAIININNKETKVCDEEQICQIFFKLSLLDTSEDNVILKININSLEKEINNIKNKNAKFNWYYLILIFVVILFGISFGLKKKHKKHKSVEEKEKEIELIDKSIKKDSI